MNETFELTILTPQQDNKIVQNQIDSLGIEIFNLLQTLNYLRYEINQESSNKTSVLCQLIKQFLNALSTEDPNTIHYEIVKKILESNEVKLAAHLRDTFARELCTKIRVLNVKFKLPQEFKDLIKKIKNNANEAQKKEGCFKGSSLDVIETEFPEKTFKKNNLFLWDYALIDFLKGLGKKTSKEKAKELTEKLSSSDIKKSKNFWFNESPNHLFFSKAILLLAQIIYEEDIKRLIILNKKQVPALTTSTHEQITQILSPSNSIQKEGESHIKILNQDKIIGSISIPAISQNILKSVFKGAKKLNSVTGHRLIRYFPQAAFNLWASGESDYRVLKHERGATEIAELLGLQSHNHVSNIKEIIQAMAYFQFSQNTFSGNLIQLSKHKSSVTHRNNETYIITVGTPLLPYKTFEDGGLLIPLLPDPPLVNPNQYHAHQYLFQMEVMNEFSNQSIFLTKHGFIQITQKMWEKIALSCGINKELLKKVHDRWIQDGTDAPKFLEQTDNEFYTLGEEHHKALQFLKEQGKIRIKNSNRGKASASARKLKNINI